ncbi:MAG: multiheme c-type cytochrome [Isosphaeraceae bacterium]
MVILDRIGAGRAVGFLLGLLVLAGTWSVWSSWRRSTDPLAEGLVAYGRGDWKAAAAAARSVLAARQVDSTALRTLARSYARLDRDSDAEALYRRLGTGRMEAEDLFLLGRGLLRTDRTGPGVVALQAALDADRDHAETLDELARHLGREGQTYSAIELAGRLSRQSGWEVRGRTLLAPLLDRIQDSLPAADALTEALRRDPDLRGASMTPPAATRLLVSSLLAAGKVGEADRVLSAGSEAIPTAERAWLLSRIRLRQGRIDEAKAALDAAEGVSEEDPMRKDPSPFVGAAACAPCHARNYSFEQHSRHATSMVKTADLGKVHWPEGPLIDRDHPEVRHEFRRSGGAVNFSTRIGKRDYESLLLYVMGSNHQGQSFLARDDEGTVRELRISRYPTAPEWDRTSQHPASPPDERGFLGRPLIPAMFPECLQCHATNARSALEPASRPEGADRGIGCERCHGPGENHILAVNAKLPDLAIARPRLASGPQVMALCGECHRAPPLTPPDTPDFIRFQSPNLAQSRCYTESEGELTCVTCHNPHKDAHQDTKLYEAVCLQCHPSPSSTRLDAAATTGRKTRAPCPIRPSGDCLSCHMPRVRDTVPRSVFTDHFIRTHEHTRPR